MREIHAFTSAIHKASHETTAYMTTQLRREAAASGWPSHVVHNMGVTYGKQGFESHVHDKHSDEAKDLEYGTTSSRPTAAVRRFSNRTHEAQTFLEGRLSKMMENL